jgi:hypothetical protein
MIITNADNLVKFVHWNSVEEVLPSKEGRYLVTMLDGTRRHVTTRYFRPEGYGVKGAYWHSKYQDHAWERRTLGVIAWAVLPEPY